MTNWGNLAKKLLKGRAVTLNYQRYNDGTKEDLDVIIDRVYAEVDKGIKTGCEDFVFYLIKEDDDSIFETYEIYRLPVIDDWRMLAPVLRKVSEQFHYL